MALGHGQLSGVVCAKVVEKAVRPPPRNTSVKWYLVASALVLLSTSGFAHDWYDELRDASGTLCCGHQDCYPVDMCVTKVGKEGLQIDDQCQPIKWSAVLHLASPDGRAHVCMASSAGPSSERYKVQKCVILPGDA